MPNRIDSNQAALASRIANEAKSLGVPEQKLQAAGSKLLNTIWSEMPELMVMPSLRGQVEQLAGALRLAVDELAANTQPDPFVDGGVTA